MVPIIAALFVRKDGPYFNCPGIDPWDGDRDARLYNGPYPVIAHPPCQRWGKFWAGSPSYIKKTGIRKVKGDDGGCFASALRSIQKYGGVLEHPYQSYAWEFFGLSKPSRLGGWQKADELGGYTCCVEQGRYGHWMRKPTYLLVYKVNYLPELDWGKSEAVYPSWALEKYGLTKCKRMGEIAFKGGGKDSPARIETPELFKNLLIQIARSVG